MNKAAAAANYSRMNLNPNLSSLDKNFFNQNSNY
jgi:hypothetical protein